jgi:tRNA nucleotidyltransferase (CCA-adding enzyme)
MMRSGISSAKIDPRALSVTGKLNAAGFDAYLVGGCVRDFLLGKTPSDLDVATSAVPEEVMKVFEGEKIIETGIKHGTVTIIAEGLPVEVTTFRIDGDYEDGRRPAKVTFVRNLREDLARRDFTINALAWRPDKGVIDYTSGIDDLNAGVIRAVGDADARMNEDGLRILRALRFASVLSFRIEKSLSDSLHRNRELLQKISAERIAAELAKFLTGNGVFEMLREYPDVLEVFIPEIEPMIAFDQKNPFHQYDAWLHTIYTIDAIRPDPVLRLTMLFHDLGKPGCFFIGADGVGHFYGHEALSEEIACVRLRALKFDNDTIRTVTELVRYHDVRLTAKNTIKWLNRLGETRLRQLLEVQRADVSAHTGAYSGSKLDDITEASNALSDIVASGQCFSLRDLAVNGDDLIAAGFNEGERIGQVLSQLLNEVMEGATPNEKDALLKRAAELHRRRPGSLEIGFCPFLSSSTCHLPILIII